MFVPASPSQGPKTNRRVLRHQNGSMYLMLLFAVAFLGLAASAGVKVWSTQRQHEREEELLNVGSEFQMAIRSYYLSSPGLVKTYPHSFEDLLKDGRFLFVKRHLRQIYLDPMTGTRNWKMVLAAQGGFLGIASLSDKVPIKTGNFEDRFLSFTAKQKYSDWVFGYDPSLSDSGGPQTGVVVPAVPIDATTNVFGSKSRPTSD